MSKVEFVQSYIYKCNNCYNYRELQEEIISVFSEYIPNLENRIEQPQIDPNGSTDICNIVMTEPNYTKNILILRQILEGYMVTLEDEEERRKGELEKLRLQAEIAKVSNNINVTATGGVATSSSTSNATSTVTITIEQTIKAISDIPTEILSDAEKAELEEKLSALEVAKNGGNKEKISAKLSKALKYIADKGVEVGIASLPYLGEIAKLFQTL